MTAGSNGEEEEDLCVDAMCAHAVAITDQANPYPAS